MFERLYKQLALPPDELSRVTQALVLARQALSGQLTSAAAGMPLAPQRIAQLGWLGMSEASISRLQPYITVLPERTTVNINTATAEVLAAAIDGLDMGRARRIVQQRALQPFKTLADARTVLGSQVTLLDSAHSTTTRYFEVLGRLRLGERVVQERSLLVRNGLEVKVLWRERTAAVMPLPGTAGALTPK
jgi:general secretion pathway protein K